jgi:hypothetical protein
MGCPICDDWRGDSDDICPSCRRAGFDELPCRCIERPDGSRRECSEAHALCDGCGSEKRQAGDTLCGPCRFDEERRPAPESHEYGVRR